MPKFTVEKNSNLSTKETFDRVTDLLKNDKELKKLDPAYKCEFDESSLSGTASGKFFKALMDIQASGSEGAVVKITVDLPFTLALAKGLIEKTLKKKLDESLS